MEAQRVDDRDRLFHFSRRPLADPGAGFAPRKLRDQVSM